MKELEEFFIRFAQGLGLCLALIAILDVIILCITMIVFLLYVAVSFTINFYYLCTTPRRRQIVITLPRADLAVLVRMAKREREKDAARFVRALWTH